jgi:transcriptional regulator with XRE-family HTH domain
MTVWRLENGFPQASPSNIAKLARVLRVKPEGLMKGEE